MTVVIGTKCKDGIVMIADSQFTDSDFHVSYDGKLFDLCDNHGGQYILGLAGFGHAFFHVRDEIQTRIHQQVDANNRAMTRADFEEVLKQCCDALYRYYYVDRPERSGRSRLREDQFPSNLIMGIIAALVTEQDGRKELLLYSFSPNDEPEEGEFHSIGSGMYGAFAVRNAVEYFLRKVEMRWKNLTMKIVSQIMMFGMRYVSSSNITVGHTYTSHRLTKEEGVKGYALKDVFPEHFKDSEVSYKRELYATALDLFGDKIEVIRKMLDFGK